MLHTFFKKKRALTMTANDEGLDRGWEGANVTTVYELKQRKCQKRKLLKTCRSKS